MVNNAEPCFDYIGFSSEQTLDCKPCQGKRNVFEGLYAGIRIGNYTTQSSDQESVLIKGAKFLNNSQGILTTGKIYKLGFGTVAANSYWNHLVVTQNEFEVNDNIVDYTYKMNAQSGGVLLDKIKNARLTKNKIKFDYSNPDNSLCTDFVTPVGFYFSCRGIGVIDTENVLIAKNKIELNANVACVDRIAGLYFEDDNENVEVQCNDFNSAKLDGSKCSDMFFGSQSLINFPSAIGNSNLSYRNRFSNYSVCDPNDNCHIEFYPDWTNQLTLYYHNNIANTEPTCLFNNPNNVFSTASATDFVNCTFLSDCGYVVGDINYTQEGTVPDQYAYSGIDDVGNPSFSEPSFFVVTISPIPVKAGENLQFVWELLENFNILPSMIGTVTLFNSSFNIITGPFTITGTGGTLNILVPAGTPPGIYYVRVTYPNGYTFTYTIIVN